MAFADNATEQPAVIEAYYKRQSSFYDATRWAFLLGRKSAITQLPLDRDATFSLLEVGCGTGTILHEAAMRYPNAKLHGLDCSLAMLSKAHKKLNNYENRLSLQQQEWGRNALQVNTRFDVIVMAYTLTMVNPHWQQAVDLALSHLRLGGYLSVVDFHDTPLPFYRRFMKWHHVSLDGHLLPYLKAQTANPRYQIKPGLGRAWRYMIFRGQKGFS